MDQYHEQFETLFTTHSDAMFRHLYYRLGDRERAKELTQEVFMRTWQQLVRGEVIEYPKAFLYRIAHNLFINEIRTNKTTQSLEALSSATGFEVVDTRADTSELAEHKELLTQLELLRDSYREVIVLRYIDGLGVKEIAELLGEKETNISMRIARALDVLRARYNVSDD